MSGAQVVEVGALFRGAFRRSMARAGIEVTEARGVLSSVFTLHCPRDQYVSVCQMIEDIHDREA